jgi:microcystin-dependent protein
LFNAAQKSWQARKSKMKISLKQIGRAGCLSALPVFLLAVASVPNNAKASECSQDGYIGSVCWTAATYCPPNFARANGLVLEIISNQALYSLIGTRFGGDGRTTFALPDLRGRTIAGAGQGENIPAVASGQSYGKETVTLTAANLPAHTHNWTLGPGQITGTLKGTATEGNSTSPDNRVPAARPSTGPNPKKMPLYGTSTNASLNSGAATVSTNPATSRTEKTGQTSPKAIPIRPPQQPLLACIATRGVFPVPPK